MSSCQRKKKFVVKKCNTLYLWLVTPSSGWFCVLIGIGVDILININTDCCIFISIASVVLLSVILSIVMAPSLNVKQLMHSARWKRISSIQSARWQHLSWSKASVFLSSQKKYFVVKKCNTLYLWSVTP